MSIRSIIVISQQKIAATGILACLLFTASLNGANAQQSFLACAGEQRGQCKMLVSSKIIFPCRWSDEMMGAQICAAQARANNAFTGEYAVDKIATYPGNRCGYKSVLIFCYQR